ncbi:MAG: hypothetical protein MUE40_12895 [Anaerolineae bacterium]|nr:hypothetical protein [Anaerolineae bacterium]
MTQAVWRQSTLNGGGFIAGLLQDPHDADVLYARSDVAGVFKSEDGGCSWRACNNGMTGYHAHDTRSFAISSHDPQVLYRGCGSVRGGDFFGAIFKSTDAGASWAEVSRAVDFYGNGEGRQYGEVIQIDPFDPACVVAGGYTRGLWITRDDGAHWHYAGLQDERITCVYFHPTRRQVIYAGTIGSWDADPVFVAQQYDYVRPHPGRLYRSEDGGASWEVLCEGPDFAEVVFDPAQPDTLHAACLLNGVLSSRDGGRTWRSHAPALSRYKIGTLTIDPHHPHRLYAAAETFPNHDSAVPPLGIYRSDDAGLSWGLVKWHTDADIYHYPSYMSLPYAGWAIATIRVDTRRADRLYITNWYGVAVSEDGGLSWDAHHFAGMENICIENLTTHPVLPRTVYMTAADHAPKISTDGGQTFHALPRPEVEKPQPDSTALVASRHVPDMILYGMKGSGGCSIVRAGVAGANPRVVWSAFATPDTAESRLAFQSRAAGISVHALAEDPFQAGRFYAYLDGILAYGAGIIRSDDRGETWTPLANPFPAHMARVPHQREWIENELLSVVIAQTKNVCGTGGLLVVDPHDAGTLYAGEWTEGIFRTRDGGASWARADAGLPFGRDRASVLNVLRADEQQPATLYAGFIREGVWRSTDGGATWQKLFPHDDTIFNATTLAVGGVDGRLLVVACEPLYYAPCASAVWVSRDAGTTWDNIYDTTMGAIRWKAVAVEPGTSRIYAGSCGNSAFVVELP